MPICEQSIFIGSLNSEGLGVAMQQSSSSFQVSRPHAGLDPSGSSTWGGELVLVEFRRVPGESSDWVLNHVRAGQQVFESEIQAAGFERVDEPVMLKENYVVRFRKRAK